MATTKLNQEGVKNQLETFGVDTSKLKGLNWGVIMGQLEADELLTSTDNDEWRDWVDYLLGEHTSWQTPRWRRIKNAAWCLGEYTNVNEDDFRTAEELAEFRFLVIEYDHGYGHTIWTARDEQDIARVHHDIGNQEHPGYVEHMIDLEVPPDEDGSPTTFFHPNMNEFKIITCDGAVFRYEDGAKCTPNGYDPLWIFAINEVLKDREVDVSISDIDQEIWDQFIGPMIDVIEDKERGPIDGR